VFCLLHLGSPSYPICRLSVFRICHLLLKLYKKQLKLVLLFDTHTFFCYWLSCNLLHENVRHLPFEKIFYSKQHRQFINFNINVVLLFKFLLIISQPSLLYSACFLYVQLILFGLAFVSWYRGMSDKGNFPLKSINYL